MTNLDQQTAAQHRARYDALRATAHDRAGRSLPLCLPPPITPSQTISHAAIPPGWYYTGLVARGTTLRLHAPAGCSALTVMLWNADDTAERYNAGDTVKLQWTTRLTTGRVLASITADSYGHHDAIMGGSTPAINARRYGDRYLRNAYENLCLCAAKHGLGRADVAPAITFFAPIATDDADALSWQKPHATASDSIDLRADLNLLVAISNTPHPLDPALTYAPGHAAITLWQPPPPAPDDLCANFSDEAKRGFENTASYLAGRRD